VHSHGFKIKSFGSAFSNRTRKKSGSGATAGFAEGKTSEAGGDVGQSPTVLNP